VIRSAIVGSTRSIALSQSAWPDEYRRRPASVIAAAALLLASGSGAGELLPGVGALDRRLAVDVRLPPWNAIAKVQTNIATRCTGALVGPNAVMTAAHCLYNRRTHTLLQPGSLHVLFGYEGGGYFLARAGRSVRGWRRV
jgi:protease YdgD